MQGLAHRKPLGPPVHWRVFETVTILAVVVVFCDESLRKALPGQPVLVTCAKDVLLAVAGVGLLVLGRWRSAPVLLLLPWSIVVAFSALGVLLEYGVWTHGLAIVRTYLGPVWLVAVGAEIGGHERLLNRLSRVFLVGTVAAVFVAMAQEMARDALPGFLSQRIYMEGHSEAGGMYNESLFASPSILAEVLLVGATAVLATICLDERRRIAGWAGILLCHCVGIYLCRIRIGVSALVASAAVVAAISFLAGNTAIRARLVQRLGTTAVLFGLLLLLGLMWRVDKVWLSSADVDLSREGEFYSRLGQHEELLQRTLYFVEEVRFHEMSVSGLLFGYGAGTAGALRDFLGTRDSPAPRITDTGIVLLLAEFGVVGLLVFLGGVLGIQFQLALAMRNLRVTTPMVWSFAASLVLLLWFLLKSHTVISNGTSLILWFGSLGICHGQVALQKRRNRAAYAARGVGTARRLGPGRSAPAFPTPS